MQYFVSIFFSKSLAHPQIHEFASEEEADQAYQDKKITNKQTVIVNGERYIYHAP